MSLDLGTLVAFIKVDDSAFDKGLGGAEKRMGAFGGVIGKAALAAGAGAGVALGTSLVGNLNLEAGQDKVAAQLGLTEAESARIGKVAGELYAGAWGDSMGDVNSAVAAVMSSIDGMADASSAELQGATAKALDFAATFDIDVQRAVQVAGQAMSTGLAADATEAFDLITAASQRVPQNLREDVLDAADEYGQFFATLGFTGEEAFATLVEGAEKGMFGIDKAGDAIKEFTIRSTDMSSASTEAYDAIGLDAERMANQILKGGDSAQGATQKILDGLLSLPPGAEQANAAIALFGTPLEDLNASEIPQFLKQLQGGSDAMEGFGGASKRMGDTLNDNAITNLKSLKRQAEQAFLWLTDKAVPIVDEAAGVLATEFGPALVEVGALLGELTGFLAEHETALKVTAGVIAAVFIPHLVAMGVAALVNGAKAVAGWTMQKLAALGYIAAHSAVVALTVAGWVLMGAQALLQAGRMAAAWLIAMGPIGIVIAAVAGLAILVIKNWDKIKKWTGKAWDWVADKVASAWQWIKDTTTSIGGAVVDWVKALPGKLVSFFLNWTLPGLIIKHWDSIKSGTIRKAGEMLDWVRDLPGRIVDGVGDLGSLLYDAGVDLILGFWEGIKSMGGWLKDKVGGFVSDSVPGPVKKVLGIFSPSRVFADLGREIPAGLVLGMDSGALDLMRASERMAMATLRDMPSVTDFNAGAPGQPRGGEGLRPIHVTMPATATPETAAAAAGGRIAAELDALGVV